MSNSNSPLSPLIQELINILENKSKKKSVDVRSPIELKLFWDDMPNLEDYYKYQRELINSEKSAMVFQFLKSQEEVTAQLVADNVDLSLNDVMKLLMFFARIGFLEKLSSGGYKVNHYKLILE